MTGMAGQYDHELTMAGISQAQEFNQLWKAAGDKQASSPEEAKWQQEFMQIEAILSSPLTRAVETTLLTMQVCNSAWACLTWA